MYLDKPFKKIPYAKENGVLLLSFYFPGMHCTPFQIHPFIVSFGNGLTTENFQLLKTLKWTD
jgi:hypothetical protein